MNIRLLGQPLTRGGKLFFKNTCQGRIGQSDGGPALVLEHDTLRNNHLFEISQHENDTVVPIGWQVWQEQVDDLDHLPAGLFQPRHVAEAVFDPFVLKVTAGVVFVRHAPSVRQRWHASGL